MKTIERLPENPEAERAVLGSILLDSSGFAYNQAISGLQPGDFALDSHRKIFTRMVELFDQGQPIDFVTLCDSLGKYRELESVGGAGYVTGLTDGLPRIKNISSHVRIVREKATLRQIINMATAAAASAAEAQSAASQILGILQEQTLTLLGDSGKEQAAKVEQFSPETWSRLVSRRNSDNRLVGLSTGIDALDRRTTGIGHGEFWTIGGRTGDGKTSLALQIAAANASEGIPVAYFSIEMDRHSLLERLWSSAGSIEYKKIRNPKLLNVSEIASLDNARKSVDAWPLYIEDADSYSISEIEARARLLVRQHKIQMAVVDYMQIVDAPGKEERHRLNKISKTLRMLAKGEGLAVIGISQMPRPKDQNMNKRPTKFDLKESGSLENDSHTVLLIFRPVDQLDQYSGDDEIIVGKQRSGETGIEPVVYLGKYMRFEGRQL